MPNLPVRGLSKVGIIKDVEPWNTPVEAWSSGCNVRFTEDKAMRAPVFRTGIAVASPLVDGHGLISFRPPNGNRRAFVLDSYGRAAEWVPATGLTDVSGGTFSPAVASTQFTSCVLQGVLYVNRETHAPRCLTPVAATFASITGMDSAWTAKILRAYQGFLVAFGVTKGATTYDTMAKWSDLALLGQVPGSWDVTDTTKLAGENTPGQMSGGIVDALNLRNGLMIYTDKQIWSMEYTGDKTFVFNFIKLWEDEKWGLINRNCVVETAGGHVCFGSGDIYTHDGVSPPISIADGRMRQFIYSSMNKSASQSFYVSHSPHLNSVRFCYVSNDQDVKFPSTTHCNRAVVWNYQNNTWGIEDLPLTRAETTGNATAATTWNGLGAITWGNLGGSWLDMSDTAKTSMLVVGNSNGGTLTAPRIYALDPLSLGSRVPLPMDAEANKASYLEHGGLPLDYTGVSIETAKRVQSIHPQGRLLAGPPPTISIGSAMLSQDLPSYGTPQVFSAGSTQVFSRATGCYLAFRLDASPGTDFAFTGFDADIRLAGKRG